MLVSSLAFFFIYLFYPRIKISIKQDSKKASESGEEAPKRNHEAYRHWAPSESKNKVNSKSKSRIESSCITASRRRSYGSPRTEGPLRRLTPRPTKEFENGSFTLKMHQTCFVRTTPEEFENETITGHFGIVFEESSSREIT